MQALPTGRAGRVLALALLLGVLALLWASAGSPLLAWYGDRAERLETREMLAGRMAALAATLPALEREAVAAPGGGPPDLLDGGTDAVAAAALQERVQDLANRSGARLSSLEVLPAQQKGAYREIGVRVATNAPWPVLVRLLQAMAEGTPRMLVDDLQVRAAPVIISVAAGAGPPGARLAEPALDASLAVYAFRAAAAR